MGERDEGERQDILQTEGRRMSYYWTSLSNQQKVARIITVMKDLEEEDLDQIEESINIIREVRAEMKEPQE